MTLLRSLIIAGFSVAIALRLRGVLADRRPFVRQIAWILMLAPYFTPVLLTGYAYASFSLSLIHHPNINTVFYAALSCWKFTPIAAVILHFTPGPISAEAIHCRRLMLSTNGPAQHGIELTKRRIESTNTDQSTELTKHPPLPEGEGWGEGEGNSKLTFVRDWIFLFRAGCARGPIAAFAAVFLFAFAEFDMASLMWVKSWTVTLFDAHAGGLALSESLRRMLGPLVCEAAAVAIALVVLGRQRIVPERKPATDTATPWFAWCYLVVAFIFVLLIPASMVLWGTVRGFRLLIQNFVLSREILASLLFATGATLFAGAAAFWVFPATGNRKLVSVVARTILLFALCLGLLGPLVLSLAILATVQLPGLLSLRDTPVPLVLTLALLLFPLALVLGKVLELTGYRSALHLSGLMQKSRSARELTWRLSTSGKFWAVVLLFVCAYWDLTASAILAPIGMTPVTVRLYNLMHYGQIAALSAMTCATFAAPVLIFVMAWATRRWWAPQ